MFKSEAEKRQKMADWFFIDYCPDYLKKDKPLSYSPFFARILDREHVLGLPVHEFAERVVRQADVGYFEKLQDKILNEGVSRKVTNLNKESIHHLWMAVIDCCTQKGLISEDPISKEFGNVILRGMETHQTRYGLGGVSVKASGMLAAIPTQTLIPLSEGRTSEALDWVDMIFDHYKDTREYSDTGDMNKWNALYLAYRNFQGEGEKVSEAFLDLVAKHFGNVGLKAIEILSKKEKLTAQDFPAPVSGKVADLEAKRNAKNGRSQ